MEEFKNIEIDCAKCGGNGQVKAEIPLYAVPDVNNCEFYEKCLVCDGTGKKILKVPKVKWNSKCPHCNELIHLGYYMDEAMKALQGHAKDNTHWKNENMKITIDVNNTRFVETKYKGENRIEMYGTYFENYRLGNYYGYWNKKEVEKAVKYLTDWLISHG